ncbi:MAG: DUF3786 domain-containing protein [Heliobacteriaceae bacterium]|nr:DUF3786 domain-containing protein [Heliobacteriaceae bacterium]
MAEMNYGHTIALAFRELAQKKPKDVAERAGVVWEAVPGRFLVPFLGGTYSVDWPVGPVRSLTGTKAPLMTQILILHYLINSKGTALSGRWISFKELPGGMIYINPFTARSLNLLLRHFGTMANRLGEAAAKVGARPLGRGDVGVVLDAFPRVPVALIIWEADDELAASGNILFDSVAADYLPTEDYAVLAQVLALQLIRLGNQVAG